MSFHDLNQSLSEELNRQRERQRRRQVSQIVSDVTPPLGSLESVGVVTDENGVLLDARTGLPAASYRNSQTFRFLEALKKSRENASGNSIFSFFDFENLSHSADQGFIAERQTEEINNDEVIRKFLQGSLTILVNVINQNVDGLRQVAGIKSLIEGDISDPLEAIKIIIAVDNVNNDIRQKYSINSFTLSEALNGNQLVLSNIFVNGTFEENDEMTFDIKIYAQGVNSTEIFDMYSFQINFNDFIFASFEDI